MDEQGLAQGLTGKQGPSMADMQAKMEGESMTDVERIMEMLLEGMEPEDLIEQGVPVELVEAAMQALMEQTQQAEQGGVPGGEPMPQADPQGLAAMAVKPV